ncbi:hypothetical protein PENPOL_c006G03126 [Penicillium polonicum]|uniref:Uncharacterized protein n=1 Tax=Penicillium polonicum TaxID=60169 RepID=A0A1V6NKW3_PENPO|nr:hypothetical protein PENPOL_c006G03126 [Penicillium polonicum]
MQATDLADNPNVHDGVASQQAPISQDCDPRFGAFGATEETPGFWAKRAIECKWQRGLTASLTRGSLLCRLVRIKNSKPNAEWDHSQRVYRC